MLQKLMFIKIKYMKGEKYSKHKKYIKKIINVSI